MELSVLQFHHYGLWDRITWDVVPTLDETFLVLKLRFSLVGVEIFSAFKRLFSFTFEAFIFELFFTHTWIVPECV